jgi:hypothetical protein
MNYRILAPLALCVLFSPSASATEVGTSRVFGLGVQVGSPTAIVGKVFLGRGNAFDFGLGFGGWNRRCRNANGYWDDCNRREGYLSLHADYLYEEAFINQPFRLDGHAGIGGRFINHSDWDYDASMLLARVPLGLDFTFRRPSWLEAYLEIAPGILLIPGLDLWVDIGLGVRAYF